MQRLRTNPLPSKLTQFRTLKNSMAAFLTCRLQMIPQLHGYPVPAHIVASVWRLLDLSSVNDLKNGIKRLRDCAYYASEVINSVPLFKADKYQFQLTEVIEYVTEKAADYGYKDLSKEDLDLVAYLMTSSESQSSSWLLDLAPEPNGNFYAKFLNLYKSVTSVRVVPTPSVNDNTVKYKDEYLAAEPKYFFPLKDVLQPLSDMVTPPSIMRALADEIKKYASDEDATSRLKSVQRQLSNETVLYTLGDMRFLDHVFALMTNISIWDTFIPPRTKADPGQNIERAKGLKMFASYLQSLLVYPHIFRYELFKQGYENLEAWHGSFPAIPADVKANYEQYVKTYDFLGAAEDVKGLYELYHHQKDPNLDSEIFVQFTELLTVYGIEDVVGDLAKFNPPSSRIGIEKLSELESPEYDSLLLSFPLMKFPLLDDVQARMLERSRFSAVSTAMFSAIMPGNNRYFGDSTMAALHALNLRVPFGWHAKIPASTSYDRGASAAIGEGKYPMRYMAPWATSSSIRSLRRDELYKIFSANMFTRKYPWLLSIDYPEASDLRKLLGREWRSMYPSTLLTGDRMLEPASIIASTIEVERLFETMTGEPYPMIRKALLNDPLSEIWATYLSSFAILFRKTTSMKSAMLVEGKGHPYGLTYSALADLQKFDDTKDLIPVPGTNLFFAFLKTVPAPGKDLSIGSFHLQVPYYYYPGNGESLKVAHLVTEEGLLHMALRPVQNLPADQLVLFDKLSVYRNDTLVIQVNSRSNFKVELAGDEYFSVNIQEKAWPGDRATAQIKYITLGTYGAGHSDVPASLSSTDAGAEVTKLTEELQKEMLEVEKESSIHKIGEHPVTEIISETAIATQINQGGGKTEIKVEGSKKKKTSKDEEEPSK